VNGLLAQLEAASKATQANLAKLLGEERYEKRAARVSVQSDNPFDKILLV
jgi:hypothetical protein